MNTSQPERFSFRLFRISLSVVSSTGKTSSPGSWLQYLWSQSVPSLTLVPMCFSCQSNSGPVLLFSLQNCDKTKFIQCLVFLSTGDILTGDSRGDLLVWSRSSAETAPGKGPRGGDLVFHIWNVLIFNMKNKFLNICQSVHPSEV